MVFGSLVHLGGATPFLAATAVAQPELLLRSEHIWEDLRATTVGLETRYPIIDPGVVSAAFGEQTRLLAGDWEGTSVLPLTYLDSTASTKMIGPVRATLDRVLKHYANSHSRTHVPAAISTQWYHEAHETVLDFVRADRDTHTAVFVGHGATGGINRVARSLFWEGRTSTIMQAYWRLWGRIFKPGDKRDTVVYTGMEHHANQLPWNKYAPRSIGIPVDPRSGKLPIDHLADVLWQNKGRVRLVAAAGVSNVTGITNEIASLADLAHAVGAEILIDGAQMLAHMPVDMQQWGIDYFVASGHKVYAPGAPGILVMPKKASPENPDEMGGGIILSVSLDHYLLSAKFPDREEAGTPNIVGAHLLASALKTLQWIDMNWVWAHEKALTEELLDGLNRLDGVTVYGDALFSRTPRAGVVSFNIEGIPHPIVSQALSDYFNIATRNECFCAQPYIKSLLGLTEEELARLDEAVTRGDHSESPGMVRASLGLYTTDADVQRLIKAVRWIVANRERLLEEYKVDRDGNARRHDGWRVDPDNYRPYPIAGTDGLYIMPA